MPGQPAVPHGGLDAELQPQHSGLGWHCCTPPLPRACNQGGFCDTFFHFVHLILNQFPRGWE